MSRRRRYSTGIPSRLLTTKFEIDRTTIDHHIIVQKPVLVRLLAVHLDGLDVVAISIVKPGGCNAKSCVAIDGHVDVFEPWRLD